MATLKYPRLPAGTARLLAEQRGALSVDELVAQSARWHPLAMYGTKSNIADEPFLTLIQEEIRRLASEFGYPGPSTTAQGLQFDIKAASLLLQRMELSAAEASRGAVWNFIACVLLPDIIRWRSGGNGQSTPTRNFLTIARNALGRLWWRAFIFRDDQNPQPDYLLQELQDEELSQFVDRASLRGNRPLGRTLGYVFVNAMAGGSLPRRDIIRDVMRRLMRLLQLISFEAMEEAALRELLARVVRESIEAVTGRRPEQPAAEPPAVSAKAAVAPTTEATQPAPAEPPTPVEAVAASEPTPAPTPITAAPDPDAAHPIPRFRTRLLALLNQVAELAGAVTRLMREEGQQYVAYDEIAYAEMIDLLVALAQEHAGQLIAKEHCKWTHDGILRCSLPRTASLVARRLGPGQQDLDVADWSSLNALVRGPALDEALAHRGRLKLEAFDRLQAREPMQQLQQQFPPALLADVIRQCANYDDYHAFVRETYLEARNDSRSIFNYRWHDWSVFALELHLADPDRFPIPVTRALVGLLGAHKCIRENQDWGANPSKSLARRKEQDPRLAQLPITSLHHIYRILTGEEASAPANLAQG